METLLQKGTIASVLVLLLCILLFPVYKIIFFHIHYQSEIEKCPLCLGKNMCKCFLQNNFRLNQNHLWTNLLNIFWKNHIIFGSCGNQLVALKRLKPDSDLDLQSKVMHTNSPHNMDSILKLVRNLSELNYLSPSQPFIFCPTPEKLLSFLSPLIEKSMNNYLSELYQSIYYSLQFNVEPLIQQVCKEWAIAPYLGGCGEIAVSEYCGNSLTWVFPKLNWNDRSKVAKQLLLFAFNATFDNPSFAFYFTDLSPDNFAVSSDGDIRLIDLDHVIVVDKDPEAQPDDWDNLHESYHDDSVRGFAFSPEEICSHRISDSNIYSICQGILSTKSDLLEGGLLHSPPQHLKGLQKLVDECISPTLKQSRFDVARLLIDALDVT